MNDFLPRFGGLRSLTKPVLSERGALSVDAPPERFDLLTHDLRVPRSGEEFKAASKAKGKRHAMRISFLLYRAAEKDIMKLLSVMNLSYGLMLFPSTQNTPFVKGFS